MNAMKTNHMAFGIVREGTKRSRQERTSGYARGTNLSDNVQLSLDKKETLALEIAFHTRTSERRTRIVHVDT